MTPAAGDAVLVRGTVREVAAETVIIELHGGGLAAIPLDGCLPPCLESCDPDCEAGPVHCVWLHLPSHKPGWHPQVRCPATIPDRDLNPPGVTLR